ncbi:SusD/RagB family nutrient-binding outer membrane lipoprotein [Pedobacter sp. SAFR-022]|uniref:SusD/RagB family nutrient-binding outer membrane lipoprotein n=1 Tax=Pedobacter sp. SAFR-022 TaxID=3436861 RepID=UPI003F7F55F1
MKKLIMFLLPVLLLASCAKNLEEYNIDQKNPQAVSASSLFSNALKAFSDNQATPSVNINNFRFWTQQWAATTYQDEPRYDITSRNIPLNYWTPFYREVLQDLNEAKKLTEADALLTPEVKANRIAQIEIMSVYTWSVLVNTWGDIPYSEALDININKPKYDSAAEIYADLFTRLDAALAQLTPANATFGSADLIYGGDATAWVKFGHSLKMKLAITVADADDATARAAIQASFDKGFTSNADNAIFEYQGSTPNNNPISNNTNPILTSRQDYVAGKTIIDKMNAKNDPRRPFYFTTVGGAYLGGAQGVNNSFADLSKPADRITETDFPAVLLDYAEVEFILAEAAERWSIGGSAATHYNNAITASITSWGGSAASAATYLERPDVAYATAAGTYKQKIGEQKYIALYNRGYDAWTEWRRLDYPTLQPANEARSGIPLRITYVTSEYTLNRSNVDAAAAALGGDDVEKKLFWDKF